MNARFELENSSLKAELLDIKSTIGSSIAIEVSKVTAIEVSKATSALSAQLECLSQTVKAHSDHLVNAKIVDRRALSKDSIDPRDLYLDSDTSWAAKTTRTLPKPASSSAPTSAPKRQKTTAENYLAMSQKEKNGFFVDRRTEKPALPGLKVVHVEGFNIPKGCGGDVFGAVMEGEYGFPAKNIKYASSVTYRIVECVIVADSFSDFERALSVADCGLTVLESFDVSVPLSSSETVPQALSKFRNRLTKTIARLSSSFKPLFQKIAVLLGNYHDHWDRTWTPPPRPTLTYSLSDYAKVTKDIEMSSSGTPSTQ